MTFRIATLLEVTFVTAVCFGLLAYVPPLGLLLIPVYASIKLVGRSIECGHTDSRTLIRTGSTWAVLATMTLGLTAILTIIASRYFANDPVAAVDMRSWLPTILIAFVFFYGGLSALIGGVVGASYARYVRRQGQPETNPDGG